MLLKACVLAAHCEHAYFTIRLSMSPLVLLSQPNDQTGQLLILLSIHT